MPGPPYPQPEPSFQSDLLRLALEKAAVDLQLEQIPTQSWMRQIRELDAGHVDVAPLPASSSAYADFKLLRVDVPLRPALLGLRLLVCRADRVAALSQWTDLPSFQRHVRLGYGSDWMDLPIMQKQGFKLVTARSTEALYDLLQNGQCDVLSRGLNEVDTELAHFGAASSPRSVPLVVLPAVALHYPLDDCFFVAPNRPDLHQALAVGMERAVRDGSWLRLLATWYGPTLRRNRFAQRQVWSLSGYPPVKGIPAPLMDLPRWLPALMASASR